MRFWQRLWRLLEKPTLNAISHIVADDKLYIGVPLYVNGIKLSFLLDTGATHTFINDAVAKRLKLERTGFAVIKGIGGTMPSTLAKVGSFKMGDREVRDIELAIDPTLDSDKFDGIIGMDFLRDYIVTIDCRNRKVILRSYSDDKAAK